MHSLHFEWLDVLKFGCYEHSCYSEDMEVSDFKSSHHTLCVSVQERDCNEECLVITFEISEYLDHPVNHASAHLTVDAIAGLLVVLDEAVGGVEVWLPLKALQVLDNVV